MAAVTFEGNEFVITMSMLDQVLSFHGSFRIPISHITSAHTSSWHDLRLRWRLLGTGAGSLKTAGVFTSQEGLIFCDLSGSDDCLVIETRGEQFPRLAITLDAGQDAGAMAREIGARVKPG